MGILLWYLVAISVPASMASDSIMDIINTKEVARLIAERRMNASTELAVDQNLLSEVATETNFEQPLHVRYKPLLFLQVTLRMLRELGGCHSAKVCDFYFVLFSSQFNITY